MSKQNKEEWEEEKSLGEKDPHEEWEDDDHEEWDEEEPDNEESY